MKKEMRLLKYSGTRVLSTELIKITQFPDGLRLNVT